jgi:hypothetical protein
VKFKERKLEQIPKEERDHRGDTMLSEFKDTWEPEMGQQVWRMEDGDSLILMEVDDEGEWRMLDCTIRRVASSKDGPETFGTSGKIGLA